MVREWAVRFRDEARERSRAAAKPGLTNRERSYEAVAAHWNTYRNRLAEIISVSQLAMVSDDFAEYWDDICSLPIGLITQMVEHAQRQGFCADDDPHLVAVAMVSMLNQFCYTELVGTRAEAVDDEAASPRSPTSSTGRSITGGRHDQSTGGRRNTGRNPRVRRPASRPPHAGRAQADTRAKASTTAVSGASRRSRSIATHYQIDFSEHYLADYMATRGIGFLGWNTRYRGFESSFLLDHALVDIGVGVRWLREVQGVETVVLLGNSGGGSLMAAYQAQAVDPHVTPLEGMRPAAGLTDLPPADGYIASAAHPGRPDVLTAWMDASVVDENDAVASDPDLDLFNEGNGPPYSAEFVQRYRSAQVARNNAITDWAETELKRVHAAGFSDRPFTVLRTWADPRMVDPTLEPTKRPANMCYAGVPVKANRSAHGIAAACTLRNWLGMWSLRHAQTRAEPHLARINCPALVINAEQDTGVYPVGRAAHLRRAGQHRQIAVLDRHRPLLHHPGRAQREGRYHRQVDREAVALAVDSSRERSS